MEPVSFRNARNLRLVGLLHRADGFHAEIDQVIRLTTDWFRERL